MVPLPPLRDGGRALPISSFRQTCLPLILDAPDCICSPGRLLLGVVQSGATAEWRHAQVISIHAPRAGCDAAAKFRVAPIAYFNPRTPYGVRPHTGCDGKFDDFNPLNLHKRYKRVLDRPKSTSEQGKNKAKLAYIHVFTVFGGCEGAGTVCALLLRTQYC